MTANEQMAELVRQLVEAKQENIRLRAAVYVNYADRFWPTEVHR